MSEAPNLKTMSREEAIEFLITVNGMSREQAVTALGIIRGEITSDVLEEANTA